MNKRGNSEAVTTNDKRLRCTRRFALLKLYTGRKQCAASLRQRFLSYRKKILHHKCKPTLYLDIQKPIVRLTNLVWRCTVKWRLFTSTLCKSHGLPGNIRRRTTFTVCRCGSLTRAFRLKNVHHQLLATKQSTDRERLNWTRRLCRRALKAPRRRLSPRWRRDVLGFSVARPVWRYHHQHQHHHRLRYHLYICELRMLGGQPEGSETHNSLLGPTTPSWGPKAYVQFPHQWCPH